MVGSALGDWAGTELDDRRDDISRYLKEAARRQLRNRYAPALY